MRHDCSGNVETARRRRRRASVSRVSPLSPSRGGLGSGEECVAFPARERELVDGPRAIQKTNHEGDGFDCPGCAWPDDVKGLRLDICENGIKHVTWEMAHKRVGPAFFAAHTVGELSTWSDAKLGDQGRLTHPMRVRRGLGHLCADPWRKAFPLVGDTLRGLDQPGEAAYYTSGRLGNEATFLSQLMSRELGTNNLPDCSNMCHEASGRALQASLGTGKGTVDLKDWEVTDALFIIGVNAASNAPRMLTALAEAHKRGTRIVHINPLVEAAATRAIIPHDFADMALFRSTPTSTLNLQPRIGGDMALLRGMAKAVLTGTATRPGSGTSRTTTASATPWRRPGTDSRTSTAACGCPWDSVSAAVAMLRCVQWLKWRTRGPVPFCTGPPPPPPPLRRLPAAP